ncbi:MAG: ribonuclease III [Planctomycetes bacterium HGW-Planctomycetes-1]|nr:MAG: ribonuclease III [Planctomycetes bacterium HGW-Planctomycetes-1]
MKKQIAQQVEKALGYDFSDRTILRKALTHSSAASGKLESNERLEFLGDSVLGMVICQALFERFPTYLEGDLTKIKSKLVSRKTCSFLANQLGVDDLLEIGPGMKKSRALQGSISAATLEALIAAIYLDGGFEAAESFILRIYAPLIEQSDADQHQENYKSLLQQHAQQNMSRSVSYEILDEKGPDHNKCFESAAVIDHKRYPSAWGTTKKEAQQNAAYNALVELGVIKLPKE